MTEPARWGLRRTVLDQLDKVHLARPAAQLYELALATRSRLVRAPHEDDGLPLPPTLLRTQAGPRHADAAFFLESGRRHAELIRGVLRDAGTSPEELDALLDFGCGCGRVLRHWRTLERTRVTGCDVNPKMVAWCRENLPFAEVAVNDDLPPLAHEDDSLDLIYAFSVFTHLTEDVQHAWMRECLRVLRPGGFLLLSTLGEHYLSLARLSEAERARFARGELVVLYEDSSGSSLCSAYHPPDYVRTRLADGFEHVRFLPAADDGRHDLHLLRKPTDPTASG